MMMMQLLIINGQDDFIIVQAAGNGYDNAGEVGVEASNAGYYAAIDESTYSIYKTYIESAGKTALSYSEFDQRILIVGNVTSSTDSNGNYIMSSGSNYGSNVDICAPGTEIYTTTLDNKYDGSKSGTSLAAPMVAGAAAYIWSLDPTLSAAEVRQLLLDNISTHAVGVGDDEGTLYPMLNVGLAAKAVMETVAPAEPDVYTVYSAYYDKIQELQNTYGVAAVQERTYEEWLSGLCFAKLVDFDSNGVDELVLAYRSGTQGTGKSADPVYVAEVWEYRDGAVNKILEGSCWAPDSEYASVELTCIDGVYYSIFPFSTVEEYSEWWDVASDVEDCDGENFWTYEGESFVPILSWALYWSEGSDNWMLINGQEVEYPDYSEYFDKWYENQEVYYLTYYLSDGVSYAEIELSSTLATLQETLDQIYAVVGVDKSTDTSTDDDLITETVEESERTDVSTVSMINLQFKSILTQYGEEAQYTCYDIDKDGSLELIIHPTAHGSIYDVYRADGENVVLCGELASSYSNCLYEYPGNGIVVYDGGFGTLHLEYVDLYTLTGNSIEWSEDIIDTEESSSEALKAQLANYTPIDDFHDVTDDTYLPE
jgi:hypothetical protein